ncbi:heavy-metal-associated domain-containing protein [Patescibacteria group bacterium]|nr:MAG: heavy-metal-associated domain-containing protein [Patescibacteria group bacterium]
MTTTLNIAGMHCTSCKALIEDACSDIAGVTSCTVDVAGGKAIVEHDGSVDAQTLIAGIGALGTYTATLV